MTGDILTNTSPNVWTYFSEEDNIYINHTITEKGVNIIDSYEIGDDAVKMRFLEFLRSNDILINTKRNINSFYIEWKAHNILYKKGILKKRTKDTGLDFKESHLRRFFYRMVCFIFNEK